MKIQNLAVFITGAGSGIGRALAVFFASHGCQVSVVDINKLDGEETVIKCRGVSENEHGSQPVAEFIQCDVSDSAQLSSAFSTHMSNYGRLDVCVNNAGIGEKEWFVSDRTQNGSGTWRKVIDVNLTAVVDGTRLAIQAMQSKRQPGAIINIASAAGLYPSPGGPIYSASKGGVVLFTRSLAHLAKSGIRVNALCPEYIDTPLVSAVSGPAAEKLPAVLQALGGFIPMSEIVSGVLELVEDESRAGSCLWITKRQGKQYWPLEQEKKAYSLPATLPDLSQARKIVVHTLSTDFRVATRIVHLAARLALPRNSVLVKCVYAGVNASDVNYSAGRYFGSLEEASRRLPFDAGFEGVGIIAAVGEGVSNLKVGSPVATLTYGAFSEYYQVDSKAAIPVPRVEPQVVAMMTSGLTASIALEQAGRMGSGEVVMVTAAAGGTGQFAVQLAKLGGNTVVATCGGADKAAMLKRLGVDRVIDYKKEDVRKVLKSEYPLGVDVVYESVGGAMFDSCLASLARFGRCVVIGMMSQYTAGDGDSWAASQHKGITEKLLWKSQSITGFFLLHYTAHWKRHLAKLQALHAAGHLQVMIDPLDFTGLDSVADAVEHLHSGKSVGKVVVRIDRSYPPISISRL